MPAAPKKSFTSKLAGVVGRNPYAALAIIVVLTILVIGLYIYYHGLFRLGPYAGGAGGEVKSAPKSAAKSASKAAAAEAEGDPETERLIAAINTK